jgi:hypothetical protein
MLQATEPGFDSRQGQKISLFSIASRLALSPAQPPIQWVLEVLSLGVKRLGHENDQSLPFSAYGKNGGSILPLPHTPLWHSA